MTAFPPLTGLRAFEAAARHLSFKRAAEELGVTPTAVSHAISSLEGHCGATLFRRRPRPLSLSPAGEALLPVLRDSFRAIGAAVRSVQDEARPSRLKVTATNAFAARWLLPRLPCWRELHPEIGLEVIGTDAVIDLASGEADIGIRYARAAPADPQLESTALVRDTFHVVASTTLVGSLGASFPPAMLADLPLIEAGWPPTDADAPTWRRWETEARRRHASMPNLANRVVLSFAEELHAIEAVIAGQGVGICSDVMIAAELSSKRLLRISDVQLAGYTFHAVVRKDGSLKRPIRAFLCWLEDAMARV